MSATKDWAPKIRKLKRKEAREFIANEHYAGGMHNGAMAWGAFNGDELLAVCAFATPCSENVRASVFGKERVNEVTELHRLAVKRPHPPNFTSWFVAQCLRKLVEYKPKYTAVLSYADTTEGHEGVIYQACNFFYTGKSKSKRTRFYRDEEGKLRHPRQCGVNISPEEAESRGWQTVWRRGKHRYLYLIGKSKGHKRRLMRDLLLSTYPYPSNDEDCDGGQ